MTAAPVCLFNIGPRERRKRLIAGIVGLIVVTAVLAFIILSGMDHLWRLALVYPYYAAFVGVFEAWEKT